ncbi:hypothetical protein [Enterococcus nangangensis]|uniref:hypothetical protein n=1 Tax=Enterococcus nangangensis TaxID=2559926 RepID=UPI0010F46F48|nr:hypothetical protein [Enterococcus nangangensis]
MLPSNYDAIMADESSHVMVNTHRDVPTETYEQKKLRYILEITTKPRTRKDFYDDPIDKNDFVYEVEFIEFDVSDYRMDQYRGTAILLQGNLGTFLEEHDDFITLEFIGRGSDYFKTLEDE